jgi:CBS domain-containing protein
MTVARILKNRAGADPVSVAPDTRVGDAVRILSEKRIGTVIVLNSDGGLEGILSERDVIREIGRRGAEVLDEPAEALMTRKLQTCEATETAQRVLERMTEGRFRHMPVMKDGALFAMISLGDVVKYRLEEALTERDALEDMVAGR